MRENKFQFSVDQVKDHLRFELAKLTESNFVSITTGKDGHLAQIFFLSELSRRFLASKIEVGYPEKTVNGYQDTHKLLLEVVDDVELLSLIKMVDDLSKYSRNYLSIVVKDFHI